MVMSRTPVAALALALFASPAAAVPTADRVLLDMPFARVEEVAKGTTVDFFLWGGDERINAYVSGWLGARLAERGITLNRVGVGATAEAVNQILSEKEAGVVSGGAVDLVWINGENFRSLKENGLLFCGWPARLPAAAAIDWTDPAIATDFGTPVEGCEAPWSRAQFVFATDTARVADPPRTMAALIAWIEAHPGRFTYPAPPDFNGAAFVRQVFASVEGGRAALAGPFSQAAFDALAPKAFAVLDRIAPKLWRGGETYPTDVAQLDGLFANGEVDFSFNYEATVFGAGVETGRFPATTRSYALDDGTLANVSFLAIPFNAADKPAAMVAAEILLSVDGQYEKARPEVWGMTTVLDPARLSVADAARFRALPRHPAVAAPDDLAARAVPEASAAWAAAIEAAWIARYGR